MLLNKYILPLLHISTKYTSGTLNSFPTEPHIHNSRILASAVCMHVGLGCNLVCNDSGVFKYSAAIKSPTYRDDPTPTEDPLECWTFQPSMNYKHI